ncbi:hypothetical protein ACA910_017673 [Epithemia clementina (nom. ined.)]
MLKSSNRWLWLWLLTCLPDGNILFSSPSSSSSPLAVVDAADHDWKGPRDRFWRHHVQDQTLILHGVDYYQTMISCLKDQMTAQEWNDIDTTRADTRTIGFKLRDEYRNNKVILMVVERAMAPLHVKAIQSLATCVRTIFPQFYEARSLYIEMELDEDPGVGGNNPTHLAPLVGVFLPAVMAEMQRTLELAYDAAGWSYYHKHNLTKHGFRQNEVIPMPNEIGFRASEHLTYKDFREGLGSHTDGAETHFTVNYAFSGPQDYDGGFFYLKYGEGDLWGRGDTPPREQILLKPSKYDCLVFLGGPYMHGVTEMTGGNREMFSSELWNFPDAPFGSTLWMNVATRMSQYIHLCNEEKAKGLSAPNGACNVNMTSLPLDEDEDNDDDEEEENEEEEEEEDDERPSARKSWSDASSGALMNLHSCFDPDEERFFLIPSFSLSPGETRTLYWRLDALPVDEGRAMVVGLPPQLTTSIQQYLNTTGWFDSVRNLLYPTNSPSKRPLYNRVIRLKDGSQWQMEPLGRRKMRRDPSRSETDLVRSEPVDYTSSEATALLNVLTQGDFGSIMSSVAQNLVKGDDDGRKSNTMDVGVTRLQVMALSYSDDAGPANFNEVYPDVYNEDNNDHVRLVIPVHIPPPSSLDDEDSGVGLGIAQREQHNFYWGDLKLRPNVGVVLSGQALFEPVDCNLQPQKEWQVWFVITLGRQATSQQTAMTPGASRSTTTEQSCFIWSSQNGSVCPGTGSIANDT